jgi:hypothetical protein
MILINKILFGIGAVLVLGATVIFVWMMLANAHLRADLAEARGNAATCHLANDNFADTVAKQNKAVAAMQSRTKQREKSAQTESYRAQQAARKWFLAADILEKQKIGSDECRAATQLFDQYRAQK